MLKPTYFCLFLFLATRIIYGEECKAEDFNKDCTCDQPDSNFGNDVKLVHYKYNYNEDLVKTPYPIKKPQRLLEKIDGNKRTIFYIFGFRQYPDHPNVVLMMKALCHENTDNVVLLDWSTYSKFVDAKLYQQVLNDSQKIGRLFAYSLQLLVKAGLDPRKIYLIGHSLGSHIAGYGGKCTKSMFTIPRITGLDPANPKKNCTRCYLTPNDAAWVDVIHTDANGDQLGTPYCMGTADYFANKGTHPQPGCQDTSPENIFQQIDEQFCSHQKSVDIYADSKRHPQKYIAVECSSAALFISNQCRNHKKTGIGYAASNVRGKYYFKTGVV